MLDIVQKELGAMYPSKAPFTGTPKDTSRIVSAALSRSAGDLERQIANKRYFLRCTRMVVELLQV
jgi:hypothetical protein